MLYRSLASCQLSNLSSTLFANLRNLQSLWVSDFSRLLTSHCLIFLNSTSAARRCYGRLRWFSNHLTNMPQLWSSRIRRAAAMSIPSETCSTGISWNGDTKIHLLHGNPTNFDEKRCPQNIMGMQRVDLCQSTAWRNTVNKKLPRFRSSGQIRNLAPYVNWFIESRIVTQRLRCNIYNLYNIFFFFSFSFRFLNRNRLKVLPTNIFDNLTRLESLWVHLVLLKQFVIRFFRGQEDWAVQKKELKFSCCVHCNFSQLSWLTMWRIWISPNVWWFLSSKTNIIGEIAFELEAEVELD